MSIDSDRWRIGGQTVTLEEWHRQTIPVPAPPQRGSRTVERVESFDWREHRKCAGKDPNFFFPGEGDSTQFLRIRRFCADCPVAEECEQYAVETETWVGWFGGKPAKERRKNYARKPKVRVHGTMPMYRFGPSGDDPALGCRCRACVDSCRKAQASWNKRRGIEK